MAMKKHKYKKCIALVDIYVVSDEEGKRLSDIAYCDEDGKLEEGCELLIKKGSWLKEVGESVGEGLVNFHSWSASQKTTENCFKNRVKKFSLPWYCVKKPVMDLMLRKHSEFWVEELE